MSYMKASAKIKYSQIGRDSNSVEIGGHELADFVDHISMDLKACSVPRINLGITVWSCDIDTNGEVLINCKPVSDDIGRAVYESLKDIYGK